MTPTEYQTRTRELLARWDQQRRITQALEIELQCHLERLPDVISDARHEGWFQGHREAGADDGTEAVLTIDEDARGIEGYALGGKEPGAVGHVVGVLGDGGVLELAVGSHGGQIGAGGGGVDALEAGCYFRIGCS